MAIYTAEINEADGEYTLTITNHRLNTTQTVQLPPHVIDQIPMALQLLRMM
ncbi:hypothetical protein [Saccharopolyspora hattusasensis]|uniref:hypothetical protein n=1 Tax=Saccharopolyspora hattusasensis TaxID=1128679 RepID=UPI003D971FC0